MATVAAIEAESIEVGSAGLNRWWRVLGGLMMNIALGTLYAWSVFVAPLEKELLEIFHFRVTSDANI